MILRAVVMVPPVLGLLLLPMLPDGFLDRLSAVVPPHPRPVAQAAAAALEPALLREDRRTKAEMNDCLGRVLEMRRDGDWSSKTGFGYELTHRVLLDDGVFFSYVTEYEIFCGGAYIASGATGLSLSVRDKGRYEVLRLFRLATNRRAQGEGAVLRHEIKWLIRDRLLKDLGYGDGASDGCAGLLKEGGLDDYDMPKLLMAESGIMVISEVPQVVRACFPPVMIDYELVRPYLDSKEARRLNWRR